MRVLAALFLLASAVGQSANHFTLRMRGKEVGEADYTIAKASADAGGWQVKTNYAFKLPNVADFEVDEAAEYDAKWEFTGAKVQTSVNGNRQPSVTVLTDIGAKRLTFRAGLGERSVELSSFERKPHAVLMNDFDPSGIEALLRMAQGAKAFAFQAVLAKGKGQVGDGTLRFVGEERGTLNKSAVEVKHHLLSLGAVNMDVWSDARGRLMRAYVQGQQVEYLRDGFAVAAEVPADVNETEVSFAVAGGLRLPGDIVLPADGKAKAIVVMVHGSGPQDRDETIGANKPFRDLAYGLARQGVASLRYDKRMVASPGSLGARFTLDDEVVKDAVAAVRFLHAQEGLKGLPVFVVGHSLGASMAPYVVTAAREAGLPVVGEVLMAGSARAIDVITRDQARQVGPEGVEKNRELFAKVRDEKTEDEEMVAGAPAMYWRDWLARDVGAEMKKAKVPTLVLWGDKDFQVTREDYESLMKAGDPKLTTGRVFVGLNHLFVLSNETGLGDYQNPEHVPDEVVKTTAEWVKSVVSAR